MSVCSLKFSNGFWENVGKLNAIGGFALSHSKHNTHKVKNPFPLRYGKSFIRPTKYSNGY
uniref:Uncharacterized protein n=1 Tax=Anguilla anguilla TaxID=7936 RepID=A0A0E9VTS8_ANGAN